MVNTQSCLLPTVDKVSKCRVKSSSNIKWKISIFCGYETIASCYDPWHAAIGQTNLEVPLNDFKQLQLTHFDFVKVSMCDSTLCFGSQQDAVAWKGETDYQISRSCANHLHLPLLPETASSFSLIAADKKYIPPKREVEIKQSLIWRKIC